MNPPPAAVEHLKANPHLSGHFDAKYGAGLAKKHLPKATRFVMCPPKYLSTKIKNNDFMSGGKIDIPRAMAQYARIKNVVQAFGTEVLEIPPKPGCQDQTFVANVAISIAPYIILAKYKAAGRPCEVAPAKDFFENLGYECIQPPFYWEGYAELKPLRDNIYLAGYGQFTDLGAQRWIAKRTGIQIVPIKEISAKQYHLDTVVSVIDGENVLVTETGLDYESLAAIKKVANVHLTPKDIPTTGITNGVVVPGKKIYLSGCFQPESKDYRKGIEWLLSEMDKFGMTVVFLDTDSTENSGADLSCQILPITF